MCHSNRSSGPMPSLSAASKKDAPKSPAGLCAAPLVATLLVAMPLVAMLLVAVSFPSSAWAHPRPLPFTYTYPTLPKGEVEIEQYVDFEPVKALSSETGKPTFYGATQFQTEFEIGITDRLELGLYATFVPRPGDRFAQTPNLPEGNGAKERLRLRLAEEGQWPIDIALYGEVVENEREIELEAKVIFARRIGDVHIVANVTGELEAYFKGTVEAIFNPSIGVTYQVTPAFHPGFEYWVRAEFPLNEAVKKGEPEALSFNDGPHHYVGPAMMFNFGRAWWSTGAYFRVSNVGHVLTPGDAFGPIWFRTVIGVGL